MFYDAEGDESLRGALAFGATGRDLVKVLRLGRSPLDRGDVACTLDPGSGAGMTM